MDESLEIIKVPADPKIYGPNQFLDYVLAQVLIRRD